MAGGGGVESRKLDQTPTWAVSGVCAVIIIISIVLEKVLHRVGEWFNKRHKKALFDALEKVKSELMILGFISLLLSFVQNYIAEICIPEKTADTMLPCRLRKITVEEDQGHRKRHLFEDIFDNLKSNRRSLAAGGPAKTCAHGKVSLVSTEGLHQLHIFIFFLAVFHVLYSALTMALGRAKVSFVRQFFRSVRKADYLTMRHGFINSSLMGLSCDIFANKCPCYITLPLYALVSQMGTHMKKSIFDEQTSRALKKWRKDAKKNQGKPSQGSRTPGGGTPEASPSTSPVHPLQRFKTTGHLGSKKSRKYFSDPEFDTPESTPVLIQTGSHELHRRRSATTVTTSRSPSHPLCSVC
ncbi:MLO-like protein 8 [Acorus calamus]|uniref:MLO-like protein 8 n=1 Tax=Acorus calamus TaxID=4465 RepID=A0AAV9D607_ACOCL|nr:MLO-like protein 8 [Acorus calamus]